MFSKLLIANRGEIAVRVARTCRRLGITCVAIYSDADEGAPHAAIADEVHPVGPAPVAESYLNIDRIIEIARTSGCDAVHPGYGLLSENREFAERVEAAGISFVGPRPECIALMGDKARARDFAAGAGVPVVPGSREEIGSADEAAAFASTFGYPVLVKAAAGGGGIGMRAASNEKRLRKAVAECMRRGKSVFGSDRIYLERRVESPRHVEIQVMADQHGNIVHLFERECSVQRRHQKVIEESPSVLMSRSPDLRERMTAAALALAKSAGYSNAGTVEFIVDRRGDFYFIEMNTRLQVEHPVTEVVTGLDLVELQLRVAAGETLPITQADVHLRGSAIECRICAEDPDKDFMPAPGHIDAYREPTMDSIRVDSGVRGDWPVSPYYDSLLAKVIAHGESREAARVTMLAGLDQLVLDGLVHNAGLHRAILESDAFRAGDCHTDWLEAWNKQR